MTNGREKFWVRRFADEVIAEAARRAPGQPIVCASGLSPSGPIHLGNLRDIMIPHLVADEIRRRGLEAVHIISWDDFDRFRKVPAGIDSTWAQHIGKPLTAVPPPPGSEHANWADHFRAPMVEALDQLGVDYRGISQTGMYTSGAYRDQILHAMRSRRTIDAILASHRTKDQSVKVGFDGSSMAGAGRFGYYPFKPYCTSCDRDFTTVTCFDDETTMMTYVCTCGHSEAVKLSDFMRGKLVWKVDWPMRWAFEGVVFEPSGVDHSSPGSSFDVGGRIVTEVFRGCQPIGPMYAFVGISGMAKMSSSRGAVPTPEDALNIMEPSLLRWLYARRRPNQSFTIAFDQEIHRMYDEWDALTARVSEEGVSSAELSAYECAARTVVRQLPRALYAIPYRTLASIVDIATNDDEQILRILRDLDRDRPITSLAEVQPRLDKARYWSENHMPTALRTRVRREPDKKLLASLDEIQRRSLSLLLESLCDQWSLEGLTKLVYGIPKTMLGLSTDAEPTAEIKVAQRDFFVLLYRLLVGSDTGPRLPTLLLSVGATRVRHLVSE